MSSTTLLTTVALEHTTPVYVFEIVDEAGVAVDASQIATLTLTYYDKATEHIINSRDAEDVLNLGDVALVTDIGPPIVTTVTWTLQPEDTVIVDQRRETEQHIALFEWTWDSGAKAMAHEVQFGVEQITYIP